MGYWQPNRGWNTSRNQPVAGEYRAIALDLHGISASQAEQLKNDMESTQQKISTQDYTNLGKQQLVGDLLYATILSYFALNNVQDAISAKQANMVTYKAPSYGIFKTNITPMYWFGIPRNVKISGLTMDVDRITHLLAHKDNDHEQWVNYNRASGARLSAMEHLVPEQLFSTPENPAHGISAVKAIQLAAAEGQKIWTVKQANLAVALANITLDNDIKNDIRNAVNAGQEVTTHEKFVNFYGKTSAGYIILDPTTGAGAYMITSGENGGAILSAIGAIMLFFTALPIVLFGGAAMMVAWAIPVLVSVALILGGVYLNTKDWSLEDWKGFWAWDVTQAILVFNLFLKSVAIAAGLAQRTYLYMLSAINFILSKLTGDSEQ